jgi:hypothetical protein
VYVRASSTGGEREIWRTHWSASPSPVPRWELVPSLAGIPRDGASGRHNHRAPEVGYILRGHVAIEFDDGATPRLRSGVPLLIPPGVIYNARDIGSVTAREAFHLHGRRGATPCDQLGLKARFRDSGWDRTIPLVCGRRTRKALQRRSSTFEGFERVRVETEGASIKAVREGKEPPILLLLRGSPPTLAMRHLVPPRLAEVDRHLSKEEGGTHYCHCSIKEREVRSYDTHRYLDCGGFAHRGRVS